MLKLEVCKKNDLFEKVFSINYENTVTNDKKDRGTISAKTMEELTKYLTALIRRESAKALYSISKERRYVYQNHWPCDTLSKLKLREEFIEKLNQIDNRAKELAGMNISLNETVSIMTKLSHGILTEIVPRKEGEKRDMILAKVEKIKTFFSDFLDFFNKKLIAEI